MNGGFQNSANQQKPIKTAIVINKIMTVYPVRFFFAELRKKSKNRPTFRETTDDSSVVRKPNTLKLSGGGKANSSFNKNHFSRQTDKDSRS
jgi:hypothetical protein